MIAELLSPQDPRWGEALQSLPHDVYHLPAYASFLARYEGGEAVALLVRSGEAALLVPLLLKEVPEELGALGRWLDATSPYGYASPVLTPGVPATVAGDLFRAGQDVLAAAGVVCGFLRMHPLFPLPPGAAERAGTLVQHGQTVWVDLTDGAETACGAIRSNQRYDIRKLKRAGFEPEVDRWERFDAFVETYLETMRRLSAHDSYLFSTEYFQGLRDALGSALHLVSVASPTGDLAAAGLFSELNGVVQYLFSGTAEAHLRQAPTKLMLEHAIRWSAERGNRVLHLGGGVGGREDSLFNFKAGFSRLRSDFHSLRVVYDRERYEHLISRHASSLNGEEIAPGFFPPYRAPAA